MHASNTEQFEVSEIYSYLYLTCLSVVLLFLPVSCFFGESFYSKCIVEQRTFAKKRLEKNKCMQVLLPTRLLLAGPTAYRSGKMKNEELKRKDEELKSRADKKAS